MIRNLLRAELMRLFGRRFVQIMTVLLLGACVIAVLSTVASSHTPTDAELRQAAGDAAAQFTDMQRYYETCVAAQGPQGECPRPDPAQYRMENYLTGVFVFANEITGLFYFVAVFLALFGFLVGASFIGAEMTSGGLTNLLLWQPQRPVVLGAKLLTAVVSVGALAVLVIAGYLGAFWGVASVSGLAGDLSGPFWPDLFAVVARAIAFVLGFTVLGFSIAVIGRHTAAALGTVAAYAVLWEVGLRIVLDTVDAVRPDRWMFSTYLVAFLDGSIEFYDGWSNCGMYADCASTYTVTWVHGALAGGVVVLVAAASAFVLTQRRDMA
ncbi:ABC transporter permease subunit [Catenuloplanes japonicus]|uniref:ABC transporter permease subunit n=1 Tax=Catenuloplanes japonicus TaxID=33876 RepID=UPI0005241FAC|nr:ABC transporter permease subunit [Catenuloplanes japonicus]